MPPERAFPGVYIEEITSGSHTIPDAPSPSAAFLGWSPQGPTDAAGSVQGWSDYARVYGGLHPDSMLGYAVSLYFANGGQRAWIVRLAPDADGTGAGSPLLPDTPAFAQALFPTEVNEGEQNLTGGIHHLEQVESFDLLCVPGLTDPVTQGQLASFCHQHQAMYLADAPDTPDPGSIAPVAGIANMNAAIYYPWLRVQDPTPGSTLRRVPPSGAVAGIYARTEAWHAPAGTRATITGADDVTRTLNDAESGDLNIRGINSVRSIPRLGLVVWGARTCQGSDMSASEWKYVPVRRTALLIERSLARGLQWVVFEPNDEALWTRMRSTVGAFMYDLFRNGAFAGSTPDEAWFVKCDAETTTQADIARGNVNFLVGFALLKPAEFVILSLRQVAGQT